MVLAAALATIAFIFLLIGAYAILLPEVGRANAAFILAGALAVASLIIALLASRSSRREELPEQAKTELPPGARKRAVAERNDAIGLIIAAFAAGLAAGRKW